MLDTIATAHPAGVTDTVGDYSYTWDANKNKTSEAITGVMSPYGFNSATGQQPAAYDADDRLVGWNRNDGNLDQAWTLTPVGDWDLFTEEAVTQDRSHGPAHEITDVTIGANTNPVQHDVKGNVTFIPAILRGAAISDDMTLWGKRGRGSFVRSTRRAVPANDPRPLFPDRLASADTDNGGTADVTFGYDALGRRVRKTTATLDTVFVQAGQQIITDYTAGAAATSPREKYVYASYIDEPILKDGTLASGTGIVYYHRNQQYSVTALTDAAGSVIERYAYDPHGALTILDASGTPLATQQSPVSNRITYTGRELDIETNLYHFRARVYSPTLGRFLNRDPLGYADGMSLYRGYFVPGATDPYGLTCSSGQCDVEKAYGDSNEEGWKYEDGSINPYFGVFKFGTRWTAGDQGVVVNGWAFSKFWRVAWNRWGTVDLVMTFMVSCRGQCDNGQNNCVPILDVQGSDHGQSGPTSVKIAHTEKESGNCVTFTIVVGAAANGGGGPEIDTGVGIKITWPNASYQRSWKIGTFIYCCECPEGNSP